MISSCKCERRSRTVSVLILRPNVLKHISFQNEEHTERFDWWGEDDDDRSFKNTTCDIFARGRQSPLFRSPSFRLFIINDIASSPDTRCQ